MEDLDESPLVGGTLTELAEDAELCGSFDTPAEFIQHVYADAEQYGILDRVRGHAECGGLFFNDADGGTCIVPPSGIVSGSDGESLYGILVETLPADVLASCMIDGAGSASVVSCKIGPHRFAALLYRFETHEWTVHLSQEGAELDAYRAFSAHVSALVVDAALNGGIR